MSINQAHHPGSDGVVLFFGERLLIFYDGCDFKLGSPLKGSYSGRVYLTSHRVVFMNSRGSVGLQSFSMPFVNMKDVDIKQPVFGANRIVGRITADPNGGWQGEAEFSITFKRGGAIEFGTALIELGRRACEAKRTFQPPPPYSFQDYGPSEFYACPPPVYSPPQMDPYYGFVPQHEAFSVPNAQSLYYVGSPPPYPGAAPQNAPGSGFFPPPGQPQPPMPNANQNSEANQDVSADAPMSAEHAAKSAEAARSVQNNVIGGYYFREDPHNVYADASAPPSYSESVAHPSSSDTAARDSRPQPPYPTGDSSNLPNPHNKKTQ